MSHSSYQIGAYYFPGYHPDAEVMRWHGEGWTEWDLLKTAKPRFPGHRQPKAPLWGLEDESRPEVMQRKAQAAAAHGLSHFIFDWYYYEGRPFLNKCLDEGFLGIAGGPPIEFALMWANHDWLNIQPAQLAGHAPVLKRGAVDAAQFRQLTEAALAQYFTHPRYWKIAGCPYFSIYDLPCLVRGLGGFAATKAALRDFRRSVRAAGFPDVHLNLVHWQERIVGSEESIELAPEAIAELGFDSVSSYVWIHHFSDYDFPQTPYTRVMDHNVDYWKRMAQSFSIPYFPNVTMGWDASPRTCQTDRFEERSYPFMATLKDNTPENFQRALLAVKAHLDAQSLPVKHFSVNAWNEWTEGSYLEPDLEHGFAYLEAIRNVFR